MLTIGLVFVGLLALVAAVIGTARWAANHTDIGLHAYARYLNRRRPLDRGWRE